MTGKLERALDFDAWFVRDVPVAIALFDRERRYVAASPAWVEGFGLARTPLAGDRHDELGSGGRATLDAVLLRALGGENVGDCAIVESDWPQQRGRGVLSARAHRDREGAIVGVIAALQTMDAGDAVSTAGAPAGLVEREEFVRRVRAALADPGGQREAALVVAIQLDNLRSVNNVHGSQIAGQAVKIAAERLLAGTRARLAAEDGAPARGRDYVARLGDDQFGVICAPPVMPRAAAEGLATRLLRLVQAPIAIGARSLRLSASIGFVETTAVHRTADDVLRDLDIAVQQAQALGPGRAIAWEPLLTAAATRRYTLAEELRRAFDNGEFTLHYQPVVRLSDSRMVGAEALLRWNHPSEGLAPSAAFVPILEETGLIVEVGSWVIREAARQIDSWRQLYGREIVDWVSVNLSARQLANPAALLATVRSLHDGGFSVHRLKLEIAETALMGNLDAGRAVLAELDRLGVRCSIDDFGTGYASLDGLGSYPVDSVKIDSRFIAQIGTDAGDKLVHALLGIAQIHGAAIIAEGIETAAQRDFLHGCGCRFGQGYLLAEPMDGALIGAYALTHAVAAERGVRRAPAPGLSPPTSAGRSRAG